MSTSEVLRDPISYSTDKKISIKSHQIQKDSKNLHVIGEIQNDESFKWNDVEIVAIFKDDNDKAVFLSSTYERDLRPNEKRIFQIQFNDDEGIAKKDYKSYEVKIESASAAPWRESAPK